MTEACSVLHMLELAMPSLITETLSMDDREQLRDTMRTPLVWLSVWNVRALQAWHADEEMIRAFVADVALV